MDNIGVYQIELNGKKYVGSSSRNLKERWARHLSDLRKRKHENRYLQNAYNKYGEDSLKFSILEVVETPEDCIIVEQKWLNKINPEYNILPNAGSRLGLPHSEETKKKLRERIYSEEHKQKISIGLMNNKNNLGHKASEETKQKLHIMQLGNEKGKGNKGRTFSEETKRKMSISASGNKKWLGKKHKDESIQKMKVYKHWLGKKHTVETLQKMSESAKRRWQRYHDENKS